MIYLDSAATSFLKPPGVKAAMMRAMDTMSSPGRGAYNAAMLAADKVYECRELACRLFNFNKPERVVFIAERNSCTEYCNKIACTARNPSRDIRI